MLRVDVALAVLQPEETGLSGHSMGGAGVADGDLVVVSRAVEARPGDIVVALVHGERTMKRLRRRGDRLWLVPEANGGGDLLDGLTPDECAHAASQLGRTMLDRDASPAIADLDAVELQRARTLGFAALSDWPAGFHRALDATAATPMAGKIGPSRMFPRLHHWLLAEDGGAFDPLRREMAAWYAERWPATQCLALFGETVDKSKWVTIGMTAEWSGRSIERVRAFAIASGYVEERKLSSATPLLRKHALVIARRLRSGIGTSEARAVLGVAPDVFKDLLRTGLVPRLVTGGRGGSLFEPVALRRLLVRLERDVPVVEASVEGWMTLAAAARGSGRSVAQMVKAVLAGTLRPAGRSAQRTGVASLLVRYDDVLSLPHRRYS